MSLTFPAPTCLLGQKAWRGVRPLLFLSGTTHCPPGLAVTLSQPPDTFVPTVSMGGPPVSLSTLVTDLAPISPTPHHSNTPGFAPLAILTGATMTLSGCTDRETTGLVLGALGLSIGLLFYILIAPDRLSLPNLFLKTKDGLFGPKEGSLAWCLRRLERLESGLMTVQEVAEGQLGKALDRIGPEEMHTLALKSVDGLKRVKNGYRVYPIRSFLGQLLTKTGPQETKAILIQLLDAAKADQDPPSLNEHNSPHYETLVFLCGRLQAAAAAAIYPEIERRFQETTTGLGHKPVLLQLMHILLKCLQPGDRPDPAVRLAKLWAQSNQGEIGYDTLPDLSETLGENAIQVALILWQISETQRKEKANERRVLRGLEGLAKRMTGAQKFLDEILGKKTVDDIPFYLVEACLHEAQSLQPTDFSEGLREREDVQRLIAYRNSGLPWNETLWKLFREAEDRRAFVEVATRVLRAVGYPWREEELEGQFP